MNALEIVTPLVKLHEGLRLLPYRCTAGKLTIGWGRNLDDRGIDLDEAEYLLRKDLLLAEKDAKTFAGEGWNSLSEVRKAVLIDMAFNLGSSRLSAFKKFKASLDGRDYERAAKEMLDSRWAVQVGRRATKLSEMMREK